LQDVAVGWAVRTDQSLQHNRFMAKKEAYDHPLYGWLLQRL
jgi:1-acyl-sn-glycerol-3-phosphate acyltransferase